MLLWFIVIVTHYGKAIGWIINTLSTNLFNFCLVSKTNATMSLFSICETYIIIRFTVFSLKRITHNTFYTFNLYFNILFLDTRESAFVYGITAAGVVYSVTEACNMGHLLQCTCDNHVQDITTDGEWEWGGCGDNVEYGYKKSKEFMDARKKKRRGDLTTRIQLHNNDAGRLVSFF